MCFLGLRLGTGCLLGWSSAFLLLWTLAPCDYITYYQARGLSGHTSPCGECVCFNLEDSAPLEAKEDYLSSHGWTLSGNTWSTLKKFFILNLSSLHPYGKPYLGYTARRWFTLLGDGSRCSAMVHAAQRRFTLLGDGSRCPATIHNCSATYHGGRTMSLTAQLCLHLLGQAQDGVAQRVQGARGLAVGGYDPGYPRQTTWVAPLGAA